jgi:hypothetical protein
MEKYIKTPTEYTPTVYFDAQSGEMIISGKSVPFNPSEFYIPVFEWLRIYMERPASTTTFTIALSYCNSSTINWLKDILKLLKKMDKPESNFTLVWQHDGHDEDSLELGQELARYSGIRFKYKTT